MFWLMKCLGYIVDFLRGPCETVEVEGDTGTRSFRYSPDNLPGSTEVFVESRRIVYRTIYRRRWVPNSSRSVYRVQGNAPAELRPRINPAFFEVVYYPTLCNWFLRWTEYPHVYATLAFIDRFHDQFDKNLLA